MWHRRPTNEDRRNSASVVELRRAAKLVQSRLADAHKSPGVRRTRSFKETDPPTMKSPAYLKPPYPNYYDSEMSSADIGNAYNTRSPKGSLKNIRRIDPQNYSSLNHTPINSPKLLRQTRSVKDLRFGDSLLAKEQRSPISDRKSRNGGYSSSRHNSLVEIPEDVKAEPPHSEPEKWSLFPVKENHPNYHSCDYFFKVMLLGDTGVGKTCFVTKFRDGIFLSGSFIATIGIDYRNKTLDLDDGRIHLQVWDTAGQERFRCLTRSYYREAQAILLLYDVQNRGTFDNVQSWFTELRQIASPDVVIILIGNKCDIREEQRRVSREEGEALAEQLGVPFLEASAKAGTNVDLTFTAAAKQLRSLKSSKEDHQSFNVHDYVKKNDKNIFSFCHKCRIC